MSANGKKITRYVKADAFEADIMVTIYIKDGHGLDRDSAHTLIEHLASETMKTIAAAPDLECPLSKIRVSGR